MESDPTSPTSVAAPAEGAANAMSTIAPSRAAAERESFRTRRTRALIERSTVVRDWPDLRWTGNVAVRGTSRTRARRASRTHARDESTRTAATALGTTVQRAIPKVDRAHGAVHGAIDFHEIGLMGTGVLDALRGIGRARAIITSGEGNLFGEAFGASQMLGAARSSARMLLPVT